MNFPPKKTPGVFFFHWVTKVITRWWFQLSFIYTPILWEDFRFDNHIFFKWVEITQPEWEWSIYIYLPMISQKTCSWDWYIYLFSNGFKWVDYVSKHWPCINWILSFKCFASEFTKCGSWTTSVIYCKYLSESIIQFMIKYDIYIYMFSLFIQVTCTHKS